MNAPCLQSQTVILVLHFLFIVSPVVPTRKDALMLANVISSAACAFYRHGMQLSDDDVLNPSLDLSHDRKESSIHGRVACASMLQLLRVGFVCIAIMPAAT